LVQDRAGLLLVADQEGELGALLVAEAEASEYRPSLPRF